MPEETKYINLLNDCPCNDCDGCYTPLNCERYMKWVFEDVKEVMDANLSGSPLRGD